MPRFITRRTLCIITTFLGLLVFGFSTNAPSVNASQTPADTELSLPAKGGVIDLSLKPGLPVSQATVVDWVQRAADAITDFYGYYPVPAASIFISPADGDGAVQDGVEYFGRRIDIHLGSDTQPADLKADWMMTHEMFHLSQPTVQGGYRWMSEGMADYLEPVARIRVGQITADRFWEDLVEGMPQGLPKEGDRGLDNTPTWGRTYWGGMLYWLLADIRVRQQTHNQKSVRDAARAVLDAHGDGSHTWSLQQLLAAYDEATGTHVFTQLHGEMGNQPDPVDLDALWKSLGVISRDGHITFDDSAPLADVRKGITSR